MAKRKRDDADKAGARKSSRGNGVAAPKHAARVEVAHAKSQPASAVDKTQAVDATPTHADTAGTQTATFQIITGSYDRVLHGFAATIPRSLVTGQQDAAAAAADVDKPKVDFTDTFLFNAHASAIRCLALSPLSEETSKITLATGATDERINLYSLSTAPPPISNNKLKLPSLNGSSITENPKNKELGALLHHSSNITALYFPTRSKLLSSAEDSTIAITRTRDWTALSTIKAPIPKPQGRPSGDTAGPGEVPSGINDFAVHPSMKLMVSVGKGEKCMRLWNLVTGKKAGVLNFGREILSAVSEGRFGSGEGRSVIWDAEGEEFGVAFERGIVLFGIDSKPKAKILPAPKTKIHKMHYLPSKSHPNTLLVSTEDGRVLLYDTNTTTTDPTDKDAIPSAKLVAQIGGPAAGISGRVKDFSILPFSDADPSLFLVITGSSDGTVRLWSLDTADLKGTKGTEQDKGLGAKLVGTLLGTYSTGTRITCLASFAMTGSSGKEEEEEEEKVVEEEEEEDSSSDEDMA